MVFSDTTTKLGLIQDCEMKLFGDNGYGQISANANRLLQFTARINRRQDRFVFLAITADGRWQYDDTNNTDYPIYTTDIILNQRDYPLDVSMIEIDKVKILNSANTGIWIVIGPGDIQDQNSQSYIENNINNVGVPYRYYKTANSIIVDPRPNYAVSAGLQVYAHRGANYFVSTDTTKAPGFAVLFHDYLSMGAALDYAIDRNMTDVVNFLAPIVAAKEDSILEFFSRRTRDQQKILKPTFRSSR